MSDSRGLARAELAHRHVPRRTNLSFAHAAHAPLNRENIAHISAEMSADHHNGQFENGRLHTRSSPFADEQALSASLIIVESVIAREAIAPIINKPKRINLCLLLNVNV